MAPPRKKPALSKGVNQAAAKAIPRKRPGGMAARLRPKPAKKAPARTPAARTAPARTTRAPAAPASPGATTAPPFGSVASGGGVAPTTTAPAGDIEEQARNTYGYLRWALDDPELGKVLRQAAAEGWDESRLKGAVFATNWFRTHGTHKVATQLKEQVDAYLVPMDDQSRRNFAFKIITGELQPTELNQYLKEQSKSMFPHLAAAIDRGVTVRDYASPYRAIAAQTLELPAEAINLNDPKWRRALDGQVDPKTNERAPMSLAEWEKTLKTDSTYGWDFTKGARAEAAAFIAKLEETFGAR